MNNTDKEQKIWIIVTIVTVTILIFIFAGITYAFFTVNNPVGSTALITNTSGKMTITYADGGSNLLVSERITPSNTIIANKTFTLTGINTASAGDGLAMSYKVGLKYTSSFSDGQIHYYIKKISSTNDDITTTFTVEANQTVPGNETYTGYSHGTLKKGNNKYTEMVTGEFPANKDEQTITFNLVLQFPDTGENQDNEKGKSINAYIEINHEITASEYIANLDKDFNGLEIDDTDDHNLRYVGATPKNYILFNNEMWRIIGVFNDIVTIDEKGIAKTENLIKIIRNDSLGEYSWDTSDSSINYGYGINEWSQAKLMYELNTDYLDTSKTNGTTLWYNGLNNSKNGIYDYSKNIKNEYIDKIETVRWNLGGSSSANAHVKTHYNQERGTTHISNPSDRVTRTNTWDGKIALMYPSDYGYASTDASCRNSINNNYCKNNNWLYNNTYQWTLSPYSSNVSHTLNIYPGGLVGDCGNFGILRNVRPSIFLKKNILVIGGTGTEIDPYIIK